MYIAILVVKCAWRDGDRVGGGCMAALVLTGLSMARMKSPDVELGNSGVKHGHGRIEYGRYRKTGCGGDRHSGGDIRD